jgi:hypothetical protein
MVLQEKKIPVFLDVYGILPLFIIARLKRYVREKDFSIIKSYDFRFLVAFDNPPSSVQGSIKGIQPGAGAYRYK